MAQRQTINIHEPASTLPDWAEPIAKVGASIAANPLPLLGGIVVVIVCLAIGGLVQVSRAAAEAQATTTYATAAFEEDETARMAALESAAKVEGKWGAEALYLLGEEAIKKSEWDKARNAFAAILAEHPDSPNRPAAAEALAFIDEANGANEEALAGYRKVVSEYPTSFAAHLQPMNIGRVCETLGKFDEAVASYKNQSVVFPESKAAADAEAALERLRISHPDLFADEKADAAEPAADAAATDDATDAAPVVIDGAVSESAPATEAAPAAEGTPAPESATTAEAPATDAAAAPAETTESAPAAQ